MLAFQVRPPLHIYIRPQELGPGVLCSEQEVAVVELVLEAGRHGEFCQTLPGTW